MHYKVQTIKFSPLQFHLDPCTLPLAGTHQYAVPGERPQDCSFFQLSVPHMLHFFGIEQ
jgi:hypothetical protein